MRCSLTLPAAILTLTLGLSGCGSPPEPVEAATGDRVAFPSDAGAGTWPGFGGPGGDFQARDADLASSWPEEGPPTLWERPLSAGYSQIVSTRGALFTMYRDGDSEVAIALRASDGRTIWESRYPAIPDAQQQVRFGRGPNATPLIVGDRLITLGYTGQLHALDLTSGRVLWKRSLLTDFDGEILDFGYSASPIVDEGRVVVLVGGERQGVVALDPDDGAVVWTGPPTSVSYATPSVIEVDGQRQLVYFSADEIIGLDAADGTPRWSHPCVNQYHNNASNVIWDPERQLLWVSTQLDGGTRVLRLRQEEGETTVDELWNSNKVSIHFWNAIRIGDTVYASIGGQASVLAAVDFLTGELRWRERGYEQANLIQAGERTVLLDANGELALLKLGPENLEVLARTRVADDTFWTAPTLIGRRLYIRDQKSIRALDLGP